MCPNKCVFHLPKHRSERAQWTVLWVITHMKGYWGEGLLEPLASSPSAFSSSLVNYRAFEALQLSAQVLPHSPSSMMPRSSTSIAMMIEMLISSVLRHSRCFWMAPITSWCGTWRAVKPWIGQTGSEHLPPVQCITWHCNIPTPSRQSWEKTIPHRPQSI